MKATYDIAETTVETTDEPHPRMRVREVEAAFQDILNVEVDLIGRMTPPAHIDVYGKSGIGITLNLSEWANETIRNGFGFFSLARDLPGYFGESEGASNVTGQVLEKDLSVKDVIAILSDNGDLEKAANEIANNKAADDPPVAVILAYAFVKFSLGWDAERILRDSGEFKKGTTAQDKGGIDGWWRGEKRQIKPGTEVPSKGSGNLGDKKHRHAFYLWDMDGGLRIADGGEEYSQMKHELAAEAGLAGNREGYRSAATLIDRSDDLAGNEMNRRFRFFWW